MIIVGAVYLGWKLHQHLNQTLFEEMLRRLKIRPADVDRVMQEIVDGEQDNPNMIEIKVQRDPDMLRAYEVGTEAFLGQAKTAAALKEVITSNCKGKRFCLSDENGAKLLDV